MEFSLIPSHLLSEAIFACLIVMVEFYCYNFIFRKKFNKAKFDIYYKGNDTGFKHLVRTATCEVKWKWGKLSPIISYKGEQIDNLEEGRFVGKFIVNPITFSVGTGYHHQLGYDGFNFPKMIIKDDDTFYVETMYLKPKDDEYWNFDQVFQAFVWKRHKKENK